MFRSNKKSKPDITSLIDISLFLSFYSILFLVLIDVFGSEKVFSYTIGACVAGGVTFLSFYFLFSIVKKYDTCFYTSFNLNDISKFCVTTTSLYTQK
jgi:hypothetical protein